MQPPMISTSRVRSSSMLLSTPSRSSAPRRRRHSAIRPGGRSPSRTCSRPSAPTPTIATTARPAGSSVPTHDVVAGSTPTPGQRAREHDRREARRARQQKQRGRARDRDVDRDARAPQHERPERRPADAAGRQQDVRALLGHPEVPRVRPVDLPRERPAHGRDVAHRRQQRADERHRDPAAVGAAEAIADVVEPRQRADDEHERDEQDHEPERALDERAGGRKSRPCGELLRSHGHEHALQAAGAPTVLGGAARAVGRHRLPRPWPNPTRPSSTSSATSRRASRRSRSPASARCPTCRRRTTGTAVTSSSTSGSRGRSAGCASRISRAARATAPTSWPAPARRMSPASTPTPRRTSTRGCATSATT